MSGERISSEVEQAVCDDYSAGMTGSDIARKYGISKSSVGNILKRHGVRTMAASERQAERDRLIVEAYEAGESQRVIADRFHLSQQGVGRILGRLGVRARFRLGDEERAQVVLLYRENWTSRQIAVKLGVHYSSICSLLRNLGIERRSKRKWFFDESFFLRADDRAAYWMGFIMADGNIFEKGKTWQFTLAVNVKDKALLETFCDELRIPRDALRIFERTTKKGRKQTLVVLALCHPLLQEWLMRWGIVPRKSYNFLEPQIPIGAYPGFLRGWFDGDGCLSIREKTSSVDVRIAGSEAGMTWYAKALRVLGFSGRITVRFHRTETGSAYYLIITGEKQVFEFYELLNARGNLRLDRKWCGLEARMEARRLEAEENLEQSVKLVESYLNGQTERDLARDFHMGTKRVRAILAGAGVEVKRRASPSRLDEETELAIVADYKDGQRQAEIAEKYGLTQPRISTILAKYAVTTIPSHVRRTTDDEKADEIALAYMSGLSQAEVAEKFGMSVSGVKKVLDRKQVPTRPPVRYRRRDRA